MLCSSLVNDQQLTFRLKSYKKSIFNTPSFQIVLKSIRLASYQKFLKRQVLIDEYSCLHLILEHVTTSQIDFPDHLELFKFSLIDYCKNNLTADIRAIAVYLKFIINRATLETAAEQLPNLFLIFLDINDSIIQSRSPLLLETYLEHFGEFFNEKDQIELFVSIVLFNKDSQYTKILLNLLQVLVVYCPLGLSAISPTDFILLTDSDQDRNRKVQKFVALAPLQLILSCRLCPDENLELFENLKQYILVEPFETFFFGKALLTSEFLAKYNFLDSDDFQNRSKIIQSAIGTFFPDTSLFVILKTAFNSNEFALFESVLQFSPMSSTSTKSIDKVELLELLKLVMNNIPRQVDAIMKSDKIKHVSLAENLSFVNYDYLLVLLARFDISVQDLEQAYSETEKSSILSFVLDFAVEIINDLEQIPSKQNAESSEKSLNFVSSRRFDEEIIFWKDPEFMMTINPDNLFLVHHLPVHLYSAQVFLSRMFGIPLAVVQLKHFLLEFVNWSEAVFFANFYIERFASLFNVKNFVKICS